MLLATDDSPTWVEWTSAIASIVTVLAAIVAGGFAYFKFARGRVFRPRCELGVKAGLVRVGTTKAALVSLTVKNAGQALWSVDRSQRNLVYLYVVDRPMLDDALANLDDVVWEGGEFREAEILTDEPTPLESGEALTTSVLIPLAESALGFRAYVSVWGTGRRGRSRQWTANAVLVESVQSAS